MNLPMREKNYLRVVRFLSRLGFLTLVFNLNVSFISAQQAINTVSPKKPPVPLSNETTAFVNVNILPMDKEIVLTNQTVIIKNGRITELGAADKIRIPQNAAQIDGSGKFLIPAFADMHVHLPYNQNELKYIPAVLQLFMINGVTTVLNLFGIPHHLEIREKVARGEIPGPVIYTSGFYINEPFFKTADEVEQEVIKQKRAGYDFIKIHGSLSREAYHRLVQTARREGIRVVGHIPPNLGYQPVLEEKQDVIAHAEEYINGYFLFNRTCCDEKFMTEIGSVSKTTADAKIRVIPTLTIFRGITPQIENLDAFLKRDQMKYIPPGLTTDWQPENNRYKDRRKDEIEKFKTLYLMQTILVKGMRDAGVKMLAGTDTLASAAALPGFSIHEELQNMVAAGLAPYEALKTATYNPAEFLNELDEFGTISAGKRADLILLKDNPLKDISQTTQQAGVMIRGRWIPESEIKKTLSDLEASYKK